MCSRTINTIAPSSILDGVDHSSVVIIVHFPRGTEAELRPSCDSYDIPQRPNLFRSKPTAPIKRCHSSSHAPQFLVPSPDMAIFNPFQFPTYTFPPEEFFPSHLALFPLRFFLLFFSHISKAPLKGHDMIKPTD